MKTLCPTCKTRYDIDPKALLEADGLARCFRCGTVFDAVAEDSATPGNTYTGPVHSAIALNREAERPVEEPSDRSPDDGDSVAAASPAQEPAAPESAEADTASPAPDTGESAQDGTDADTIPSPPPAQEPEKADTRRVRDLEPDPELLEHEGEPLPFRVPEDLTPLEPSPDVALDVTETLYEKKSRRGLVYGLITILLVGGLAMQLAWQHRKDLLRQYPLLAPLCDYVPCFPKVIHAPDRISVLQRDIQPAANDPGSLTLSATIRNDADIAQHLPDIQLSLLDNNGAVLIRRRLSPADYLFPTPADDRVMKPGEVVTIALDFKDPGHEASGFVLDFL